MVNVLEYIVKVRKISNGDWLRLKNFPSLEEKTGKKVKHRFLWWVWEEDEIVIKTKKDESINFAKTLLNNIEYQDVIVTEKAYYDSAYGDLYEGIIWSNGRWI